MPFSIFNIFVNTIKLPTKNTWLHSDFKGASNAVDDGGTEKRLVAVTWALDGRERVRVVWWLYTLFPSVNKAHVKRNLVHSCFCTMMVDAVSFMLSV
jgi:hypothetical protein